MMLPAQGRWVLLLHEVPPSDTELGRRGTHWDLMFEDEECLWTWSIQKLPPGTIEAAMRLPNHRKMYLDYEGEVSNGRGSVTLVARGHYQRLSWEQDNEFRLIIDWPYLKSLVRFQPMTDHYWRIDWSSTDVPSAT